MVANVELPITFYRDVQLEALRNYGCSNITAIVLWREAENDFHLTTRMCLHLIVTNGTRLSVMLALSINFVDMFGVIGTVNITQNLNRNH